jgi:hypothetical protein
MVKFFARPARDSFIRTMESTGLEIFFKDIYENKARKNSLNDLEQINRRDKSNLQVIHKP